jgi:hypothetical protein
MEPVVDEVLDLQDGLVSPCDTPHRSDEAARSRNSPCIRARTVALLGKKLTPSCREGFIATITVLQRILFVRKQLVARE